MKFKNLEQITGTTRIWTPELDITLPIDCADIPDFQEWVNWSGWKGYSPDHKAFDFAAYLTKDERCILGLPKETPVRAIADGVVRQTSYGLADVPYACFMNIEHSIKNSGLFTSYYHIDPKVKTGQEVKKGDIIATLYKDEGSDEGKLVHLHFEMRNGWEINDRIVNPETIFHRLNQYSAIPQGNPEFKILGLEKQPDIHLANFKKLLVDNT
ncbi:MAG: M23 family metallopeptidase [Nanoarchaeota archaeon]